MVIADGAPGLAPAKRVCVVGVGSVGLTAVKWCIQRGLEVVAFERREGCGGIWRSEPPGGHSPAYDSLMTNSSTLLMNLPDFPFPFATSSPFPKHDEILRYLEAYKAHFALDKFIRWQHEVTRVSKETDGGWIVQYSDVRTGEALAPERFDAVLVCTGKLWDPRLPHWAEQPGLARTVIHAKEYRNPERFRGQGPVLVVGVGNSALDIALELAQDDDVEQVFISCRRGTTVIPTMDGRGQPVDVKLGSRFFQFVLPRPLRMLYILNLVRGVNKAFAAAGAPAPPGGLFHPHSPTSNLKQSAAFLAALRNGRIKFVAGFEGEEEEDGALRLADGQRLENVRSIICCTGYTLRLDKLFDRSLAEQVQRSSTWKDDAGLERTVPWLRLFRHMMLPSDPSLMMLGFITSFGNETCIGEMQARWATAVIAGVIPEPTPDAVARNLERTEAFLERSQPSLSGFVRYIVYMDELAADLGCKPDPRGLFRWSDPASWRMAFNVLFRGAVPAQYRVTGPDASEVARKFVSRL